jgi:hypothetical protein
MWPHMGIADQTLWSQNAYVMSRPLSLPRIAQAEATASLAMHCAQYAVRSQVADVGTQYSVIAPVCRECVLRHIGPRVFPSCFRHLAMSLCALDGRTQMGRTQMGRTQYAVRSTHHVTARNNPRGADRLTALPQLACA